MKFKYQEYDRNCEIQSVRSEEGGAIDWDSRRHGALVLRCRFKHYPYEDIQRILDAAAGLNLSPGVFSEVQVEGETYGIRLVQYEEKARQRGCDNITKGYSYLVFACKEEDGGIAVYSPKTRNDDPDYFKRQQRIDIPLRVTITYGIVDAERKGIAGLLGKITKQQEVPTGFFIVDTDKIAPQIKEYDFHDGDLYYIIGKTKIPITKAMLQQAVYIKADIFPQFRSTNDAIEVTCQQD